MKMEVELSGAEIKTVDTRTAVWVSTAEKIVLRESQTISLMFRVVQVQALYENSSIKRLERYHPNGNNYILNSQRFSDECVVVLNSNSLARIIPRCVLASVMR